MPLFVTLMNLISKTGVSETGGNAAFILHLLLFSNIARQFRVAGQGWHLFCLNLTRACPLITNLKHPKI